jgi:hypothetical protein
MLVLLLAGLAMADDADETVVVEGDRVAAARQALAAKLADEGYSRSVNRGDMVVFKPDDGWKWRVRVHDDGWVDMKKSPPRIHAAGADFASDNANPALWALCLIRPDRCIDPGTNLVQVTDARVVKRQGERMADAIDPEVRGLRDAITDQATEHRLYVELPAQCAQIWGDAAVPAADRRAALFDLWDSRADTSAGNGARDAIAAFLRSEVQGSADKFTDDELAAFNARRHTTAELVLASQE